MNFNNLFFIFCFLPTVILISRFMRNTKALNIFLLAASLLFYGWADVRNVILLGLSIGWNYLTGNMINTKTDRKQKQMVLAIGVLVNLGLLVAYKYTGFLWNLERIDMIVPVGLSYFTFSEITYLADIYKERSIPCVSLLDFALYISFFGKISMGPIVPYHSMEEEINNRKLTNEDLGSGSFLFIKGLAKKVILADTMALVFKQLASNSSIFGTWIYVLSYMLQIYFDFSGYSDMAIGIGRIFGFHWEPNFRHPYLATSIQDFWRRWHISLSHWFRDYLYIPLGGNRKNHILNLVIVWFCTGLWHGANITFIVWGLYYCFWILLEHQFLSKYLKKYKILARVYALLIIFIGWIFFFSPDIGSAFQTIGHLLPTGNRAWIDTEVMYVVGSNAIWLLLAILFCTNIYQRMEQLLLYKTNDIGFSIITVAMLAVFALSVVFIISSSYQSFLYYAF